MSPLHDGAASALLLGGVGVLPLVDLDGHVSGARVQLTESRSHTWPHTDGTMKSRVLLQ